MPVVCPKCRQTLYAMARLRPEPRMGTSGVLLMILAGVAAAGVYFVLLMLLRNVFKSETPLGNGLVLINYPPTLLLSIPALPIGLVVGFLIARVGARLPKYRRLRCRSCGWTESYPADAIWESSDSLPVTSSPTSSPAQPQFQIVDDSANPWKDACAWAWSAVRVGKSPEQIIEELVGQGWPREDVERMVYGIR